MFHKPSHCCIAREYLFLMLLIQKLIIVINLTAKRHIFCLYFVFDIRETFINLKSMKSFSSKISFR